MVSLANDYEKSCQVLSDLQTKISEVIHHVKNLNEKVKIGELNTSKGIGFLEVKHDLLLGYLINLSHLMLHKTSGKSIQNLQDINRLVEIRTVLERMRPIDQKLKYQIDKLVKTAVTGTLNENDPLRFKPNPENLVSKLGNGGSESESDENDDEPSKAKLYVPPKLAAVHYAGDETALERKEQRFEKAKTRALSSSIIQELREEYDTAPLEIRENRDVHRLKADVDAKERETYEEQYFTRLEITKKQKQSMKKMSTISSLDVLTKFGDISALDKSDADFGDDGPSKKRKRPQKGKGKKFGKKKKKF